MECRHKAQNERLAQSQNELHLGEGLQLSECDIEGIDVIYTAPYMRSSPEDRWVKPYEEESIPPSLYRLYTAADYCSIERAPRFLDDQGGYLWTYLEQILNGLREALEGNPELVQTIRESTAAVIQGVQREGDAHSASELQRSAFRDLVINLVSALDLLAELIALILSDEVPRLRLGQAAFKRVYEELQSPRIVRNGLVSPSRHYTLNLLDGLRPLLMRDPPESQWLDLLYRYRNKVAHLTVAVLMQYTFHDGKGEFFSFTPRQWPFLLLKRQAARSAKGRGDDEPGLSIRQVMERELVQIDVIEYCERLSARVTGIIETGCNGLLEAYLELREHPLNESGLEQLIQSGPALDFEYFS